MDTSSCVIRHVERVDRKKSDMVGLFSQWEFPTLHTTWVVRMPSSASGELESGREGSSLPGNTVGHLPRPTEGPESHSLGGIPVPSDQAQRVPPALPEIPGQTQTNMPPGQLHYDDSPKFIWARKWYSENSLQSPSELHFHLCLQKVLHLLSPNSPRQHNLPWVWALHCFSFFFKYGRLGTSDYELFLPFDNHSGEVWVKRCLLC